MPLNKAFHVGRPVGCSGGRRRAQDFADAPIPTPPGFRLRAGEDTGRPRGDAAPLPGWGQGPLAVGRSTANPPASIAGPPRHQGTSPADLFPGPRILRITVGLKPLTSSVIFPCETFVSPRRRGSSLDSRLRGSTRRSGDPLLALPFHNPFKICTFRYMLQCSI
jgi:hypothetical protein